MESISWQIDPTGKSSLKGIGFAAAWKLRTITDLSSITRDLPDGVTIFSTRVSAGQSHLKGVLQQAFESSNHGISLARNSAIDLLMRLTCQNQIKSAVQFSEIATTQLVGAFGFVQGNESVDSILKKVEAVLGNISERDDKLLEMDETKMRHLRRLHSIPENFPDSQVVDFLLERSALLCFSK